MKSARMFGEGAVWVKAPGTRTIRGGGDEYCWDEVIGEYCYDDCIWIEDPDYPEEPDPCDDLGNWNECYGDGGDYYPPDDMYEIILDPSFMGTKAECVYNKLNNLSTSFASAIKQFDGEFPVAHLRFKTDATMTSNIKKAYTSPPSDYVIDVVLNGNSSKDASYQQRPNLLVAKTIIHEVIHAEMFRKLLSIANNGGSLGGLTAEDLNNMFSNGDYPGIFDYYTRYGVNDFQHNQMAAHYRDVIADALEQFDNSTHSSQFYLDLAWEGLIYSNDPTWSTLSASEKSRIKNLIDNYINQNKNESCQ
ncbi:hypothetical protein [Sinomicrobium soli]|uniref:hypothetical protein n=1 Tax=Sinomicrobium sp. N-1-3-6 TaxID=2219864 RepID=UPI0011BF3972|nr:hypothetical protein [Sinomicrobium sp. N-1-3-6]